MAIFVNGRVINGTPGYDNIVGNSLGDHYQMTANYEVTDSVNGGAGADTVSYVNADRAVDVTMGSGRTWGHTEADFVTLQFTNPVTGRLFQNVETQTVTQFTNIENVIGSSFADTINGNAGANRISGGAGDDVIDGGGDTDIITGGRGGDYMTGGAGADRFVFTSFDDSAASPVLSSQITAGFNPYDPGVGVDYIPDFLVGQDIIDLSGMDANSTVAGDQAFKVVEGFTGHAGELVLMDIYQGPTIDTPGMWFTAALGDLDGDAAWDFQLRVTNPFTIDTITSADFIL